MKTILIILGLIIIVSIASIGYSKYQDQDKNPVPELRTERAYEMYRYHDVFGIYCIDGYKWLMSIDGPVQFFRVDSKGNSVPARCDE